MKKTTHTKEERQAYFKALRDRWTVNKASADQDTDAKARYAAVLAESPHLNISYSGFYFVHIQMKSQNLDGLPYVDAKTFNGWNAAGFKVAKGQKSTVEGITWISGTKKDDDDDNTAVYPKRYALFHRSQVEALA